MFDIIFENNINVNNVSISKQNDKIIFSIDNTFYLEDNINYISGYCNKIPHLTFDKVLIGGFGLGIIPYYLEKYKSCLDIDIVEINHDVITATKMLNHLSFSNIIHDDFLNYYTEKKYDLIIVDLWWLKSDHFEIEKEEILDNYSSNLNEGGKIYIPITDELI
jgi:predicted membrane-bound spermidine synthase